MKNLEREEWWPHESIGQEWSYLDQKILAPMVRLGTLPLRLLSAHHGATMVYSEEIIDRKVIGAQRVWNDRMGTIDYFLARTPSSKVSPPFFRTIPGERIVFQMGTSDSNRALLAANEVCADVKALDINMGCPKHFSLSGGMGAALLKKPEVVEDILKTLKRNLNIPVTCKIRLLEDAKETLDLVKLIENCGVDALGVHGRYITDRPRFKANLDGIAFVVSNVSIPVIHNADIFYYEDLALMKERTGAASVMVARGWN